MSNPNLLKAALVVLERGWLAHPLGPDSGGLPKRPLTKAWTSLERNEETVRSLDWNSAIGMGLVLGEKSSGLVVLDIDDEEMFNVSLIAVGGVRAQRWVRTVRKRGHLYFQCIEDPGPSSVKTVMWEGREVKVELKSNGTQVAAPPTPGYSLPYPHEPPKKEFDVQSAYQWWVDCMEDTVPGRLGLALSDSAGAGFPEPWQPTVAKEGRNNAAYIEAHKLREAGMALEQAIGVMQSRFDHDYEKGDITWGEVETTVRSAYRKGEITYPHEGGRNELGLLGGGS